MPASQRNSETLALLVSRRFGPLFSAQFLSAFNDNALRNALVLMIAYHADASAQLSAQLLIPAAATFGSPAPLRRSPLISSELAHS
jgi:hypothetical protein